MEALSHPELKLIAHSEEAPERMIRFLTGAIMVCGGHMLSRRFHSDGSAALECEFLRARCVDIYSVLVAAGLQLSRSSHFKLAELCQCTRAMLPSVEEQIVLLELEVIRNSDEGEGLRLGLLRRKTAP